MASTGASPPIPPRAPRPLTRRVFLAGCAAFVVAGVVLSGCGVLPDPPEASDTTMPTVSGTASEPDTAPTSLSPDGFTRAERAAVRVRNVTCEGLATGSGFALEEHLLVTNRHVIEGALAIQVSTYDGREVDVGTAAVATIADLALVRTVEALPAAVLVAASDPEVGDPISVVGYPSGGPLTTSFGTVLDYTDDPLGANVERVFVTDAPVEPGSSGSAVVNEDGNVVGVVYARSDEGQSFAVPVSMLHELLDQPDAFAPPTGCD